MSSDKKTLEQISISEIEQCLAKAVAKLLGVPTKCSVSVFKNNTPEVIKMKCDGSGDFELELSIQSTDSDLVFQPETWAKPNGSMKTVLT